MFPAHDVVGIFATGEGSNVAREFGVRPNEGGAIRLEIDLIDIALNMFNMALDPAEPSRDWARSSNSCALSQLDSHAPCSGQRLRLDASLELIGCFLGLSLQR